MLIDSYFSNNNWVFTEAQYTWTKNGSLLDIMLIDSYFSNNNWVFTKAQYTWTKMAENVTDVTMTSGKITSLGKKISDFHEQLTVLCHTVNILLQVVI